MASLSVGGYAVAGPAGGRVSVELALPGQPRILWHQALAPFESTTDVLRCGGGTPWGACVIPPGAHTGAGPLTLRLRATGDAALRVTRVRYVWRAEVPP